VPRIDLHPAKAMLARVTVKLARVLDLRAAAKVGLTRATGEPGWLLKLISR